MHVMQRTWQKWEAGTNEMHPAFWELFVRKLIERECELGPEPNRAKRVKPPLEAL